MNKADVAKLYAEHVGEDAFERERRAAAPRCKACGAAIRWVVTYARDQRMPVDYDPHEDGNVVVYNHGRADVYRDTPRSIPDTATLHFSHHATCPHADEFRGRPAPQPEALF